MSDESDASDDNVLLPHGGYEHLRSYKVAEAVYDATVRRIRIDIGHRTEGGASHGVAFM